MKESEPAETDRSELLPVETEPLAFRVEILLLSQ
jgi:hypothetical protein